MATQRKPLDAMQAELRRRVRALQARLKSKRLDGVLVYDPHNRFYLTGMHASLGFLFVTPREAVLLVDGRYIEAARARVPHCDVRLFKDLRKSFTALQREFALRKVGFEGSVAWATVQRWMEFMPAAEFSEAGSLVLDLRLIKSALEARAIESSAKLNDAVFEQALGAIRNGATEIDVRNAIRAGAEAGGAEGLSFDSIVAAGAMSARPHYDPQARPLELGHFLLIDMGMLLGGYCSDMTRVVGIAPKLKPRLMKMYNAVLACQQAALAAVGPGVACSELDRIARNSLKRRKLDQYFTHGLGHGVGLEIHEAPTLNSRSTEVLRPGMVVTIEPGVYIPGVGGVRIEDLVLVTKTGHKVLSRTPKQFRLIQP